MINFVERIDLALSLTLKLAEANPYLSNEDLVSLAIFLDIQDKDWEKRILYYTPYDNMTVLGLYSNHIIEQLASALGVRAGFLYILFYSSH